MWHVSFFICTFEIWTEFLSSVVYSCGLWGCGRVAVWMMVCSGQRLYDYVACMWRVGQWPMGDGDSLLPVACCLLETWMVQPQWYLLIKSSIQYITIFCMWMMYGCNYCVELNVLSGYMYCYRFELPLPDRNRYIPDRYIPFPISRNTAFVFPSAYPVPVSVPDKKKEQEWLGCFPDHSWPFSTLDPSI